MGEPVILKVGGRRFEGWKTVEITRGIDGLAGDFFLGLSERWPGQPDDWGIEAGDACEVFIGEDRVMTGWIDQAHYSIDPERHPVEVSGREKTCDLIDCSALHRPGSWKNRRLEQIAAELAKPFGIGVSAAVSTGAPFASFALQQGETVFEAITRMTRQRGVLAVTTEAGDLEFRRPGGTPAGYSLALGETLESIRFRNSLTERFSEYVVKGYASDGSSRPKASARDPAVGRHRPLLIVHDDESSPAGLAERAKWEATVRAGRSQEASAVASGWRTPGGDLYRPDRIVPVSAAKAHLDGALLISRVSYSLGERGSRTTLTLTPREAFSLLAIPAPGKRRRKAMPPPGAS